VAAAFIATGVGMQPQKRIAINVLALSRNWSPYKLPVWNAKAWLLEEMQARVVMDNIDM
jgi:hypothetical protein